MIKIIPHNRFLRFHKLYLIFSPFRRQVKHWNETRSLIGRFASFSPSRHWSLRLRSVSGAISKHAFFHIAVSLLCRRFEARVSFFAHILGLKSFTSEFQGLSRCFKASLHCFNFHSVVLFVISVSKFHLAVSKVRFTLKQYICFETNFFFLCIFFFSFFRVSYHRFTHHSDVSLFQTLFWCFKASYHCFELRLGGLKASNINLGS